MRILVVDDAPVLCAILRRIAVSLGHAVVGEAPALAEALVLARALTPDSVVLDGRLAGASLSDAIAALHEAVPGGAVFVAVAFEEAALVRVARASGAAGLVRRPFSRTQIRDAFAGCGTSAVTPGAERE